LQLLRQNGRILLRLEALERQISDDAEDSDAGLALGEGAPNFELSDVSGERWALSQFRGRSILLIFFNSSCRFCVELAPALANIAYDGADDRPIPVVVAAGDPGEIRQLVARERIRCRVLLQDGIDVTALYRTDATPTGYVIDPQGRIASGLAQGATAVLELANSSPSLRDEVATPLAANHAKTDRENQGNRPLATSRLIRDGLKPGVPAPDFSLLGLDGKKRSLKSYLGTRLLLIFSDPECEPCDELAPRLERLHRRTPGIQVLMVSRRGPEDNRRKVERFHFTFPVVLQRHWEISRLYGMFATPIAYVIDEDGVIAADVAVGVEPILTLLSGASGRAEKEVRPASIR